MRRECRTILDWGLRRGHVVVASRPTRFWIGDWVEAWGNRDRISLLRGVSSAKHVFLRNEPTVFERDLLCILFVFRMLCRLSARFFGGFVFQNEPTGRGVLMPYDRKSGGFRPLLRGSEGFLHCAGQGKGAAILL